MDDIRNSFSRFKKDLKHRLKERKRKPDRTGTDAVGERDESSGSLLRPEPHIAASGHDEEGSRTSSDGRQVRSRDRSPQPEPMPAGEGSDDLQRREADVDEKEVSESVSCLDPDIEVAAGSGPSQEVEQVYPSTYTPSIPGQPDGMKIFSPQPLCLIVPSDNADIFAIPGVPGDLRPNESAGPSAAANDSEKKSNWKSTASAMAKLLLRGVSDSADAFSPLKSVAGGLYFILENCEVRSSLCIRCHSSYRYPRERRETSK